MEKESQKKLSVITQFIIWASILKNGGLFIRDLIIFMSVLSKPITNPIIANELMCTDPTLLGIQILERVIIVAILYFILNIKKWALYGFFIFEVFNGIITGIVNNDLSVSLGIIVVWMIMMSLLLCIPRKGVMGWRLFFPKQETKQ